MPRKGNPRPKTYQAHPWRWVRLGPTFRYIRLREPPYSEHDLVELAARLRGGPETWVYFRHEDEPTAPAYAARLLELLA